jgi:pSer/pThr/pTyr-binding forkhead associated (FHA) protein/outer membrane biosynthesis protein TonB
MSNKVEITLVIREPGAAERKVTFAKRQILIGRAVSCDVALAEAAAGKEHARIEVTEEGAVRLRDLGTSVGVSLNGSRVDNSILVSDSDEVRIGDTTILLAIKKAAEGLAGPVRDAGADKWKAYEIQSRPVINIAQLWSDSVVAVSRFGKSVSHLWYAFIFSAMVIAVEAWFCYALYTEVRFQYAQGKLDDYSPFMVVMILTMVALDGLLFMMMRDMFRWPRECQSKSVRIGQDKKADFFVPEDVLGEKLYRLIVRYKGRPALNLENQRLGGKLLIDGQVLSVAELRKTSLLKEKHLLPLTYRTRARIEIGHITFVLGLDPSLREPKGAVLSSADLPALTSFSVAFLLAVLFMLGVMAAPKTKPVVRLTIDRTSMFQTLVSAAKQKEEEKKKEEEAKKEEDKSDKKEEENPLKDEAEKPPVLEEKVVKEEVKAVRTVKMESTKSIETNLVTNKTKTKLSSMTTLVSKEKVSGKGALGALGGMKVIGAQFGDGGMMVDSAFQPVGDLAIAGLGEGTGDIDLGGTAGDSDPFDLSKVQADGGLAGDGSAGGFASVGADGASIHGGQADLMGKDLAELDKKKLASSVKGPQFKEKAVKITPEAKFDMSGGGKLDREVVKEYIRKQLAKIRWCYQTAFQKKPDLEGKLTVSFVISPTGSVMKATVINSTLGDPELHKCIEGKVMTWKFPAPQGGGVVKVNYPFVLRKQ